MDEPGFDPADLEPGVRIAGRYEILGALGKGGFGWVYRARDHEVGETVALKFLNAGSRGTNSAADDIRHEIRIARKIGHPHVIRLYDIGETEGCNFISMEHVEGESLSKAIARGGRIPVGEAIRLFHQLAEGVGAAHRHGVVHRDLKPGNVLINTGNQVKVLDFGLAALAGRRSRRTTDLLVGTPQYMSPGQVEGRECTRRSDIYSLGVIFFEMLTGEVPFQESTQRETALARLRRRPPDPCSVNPALPRWLGDVVLHCLEREPEDRFASVDELLNKLDDNIAEEDARVTATVVLDGGLKRRSHLFRQLRRAAPAVAVLAGVALTAPALLQALRPEADPSMPLFADGVARIAVVELELITDDAVTHMVAAGLSESLRSRLGQVDDVTVMDVSGLSGNGVSAQLANLGVEQVISGRVGRLGAEIKILVWVTGVPGRERWLTVDRSLQWEETWEGIDALAVAISEAYILKLEQERGL